MRDPAWKTNIVVQNLLLVLSMLLVACGGHPPQEKTSLPLAEATFVGRAACTSCHPNQVASWEGSHHDLAMQVANPETVLGDFEKAQFGYNGIRTTFYRNDEAFYVRTDGPDGELNDYRIAYTFGVEPLQQYLIEFPDGRIQALSICWDTRPAEQGGQRWFHLYPEDAGESVDHGSPLHWTGAQQNWNFMCAECHSTNLQKNFDLKNNQYATTFAEIDVSCEACHGPASNHLAWAQKKTSGNIQAEENLGFDARLRGFDEAAWIFGEDGTARRSEPRLDHSEVETCGSCHSRRSSLAENSAPGSTLADHHQLRLLEPNLYYADGQIDDEVYVYGSFIQSKMYHAGVTCSDCHDAHSTQTFAPEGGVASNTTCARCHLPTTFDTTEHHFHPQSTAVSCVDCHMPAKNYMVVDPRRDHSLRVPRPDLTLKTGSPNACNGCHEDRDTSWAAEAVERWYGPERSESFHYGEALHAGRSWQADAEPQLHRVIEDPEWPGIARASAVELLVRYPGPSMFGTLASAATDPDPLVRRAAAQALGSVEPTLRLEHLFPLLDDPMRSVRVQATQSLLDVPAHLFPADQMSAFKIAIEEYRTAQLVNADRAEAHLALGWLLLLEGDAKDAEAAYRTALRVQPRHVLSHINLADLLRQLEQENEAEKLLREALEIAPQNGDVHHALGLSLIRQNRLTEGLPFLTRASAEHPDEPRYAYVEAVAFHSAGESQTAVEILQAAHDRFPAERTILLTLATLLRDLGELEAAITYAERLLDLAPWDDNIRSLLEQIRGL